MIWVDEQQNKNITWIMVSLNNVESKPKWKMGLHDWMKSASSIAT